MSAIWFYHLTDSTVVETLKALLPRALDQGWRVLIRGGDPDHLSAIDAALWQGEGFLPHGLSGGPHDGDQPVLLTCGPHNPNDANCLFAVDRATIDTGETERFDRVCLIFEDADAGAVEDARALWRSASAEGRGAVYWTESGGRWRKTAQSGPDA